MQIPFAPPSRAVRRLGSATPAPRRGRGGRVASAVAVEASGSGGQPQGGSGPTTRGWQELALDFCDRIPEADYACSFFGGGMSKLVLDVQERDPDTGEWTWVEDRSDPAAVVWDQVQDPGGGREQLSRMIGELMFANGEGYLLQTWDDDTQAPVFEFVSVFELRPTADGFQRTVREGGERQELVRPQPGKAPSSANEAQAWRVWRPHRRRTRDAHAPMRAVTDVCQELLDLTMSVRAQTRSRLSRASILFLPPGMTEEDVATPRLATNPISGLAEPVQPDPADDPEANTVISRMVDHFSDPLVEPDSVTNLVPYIISGWNHQEYGPPKDYYLQLYSTQDAIPEMALREEAVTRFARGVSLPVEIILGMGAANHWSGWLIDDQTWQAHLQPEALRMVRDLTKVYLWAQLRAMRLNDPTIAQNRRVWYDETGLVVNPDRSKNAIAAHAHRAISDAALRRTLDFNEADAPSEADPNSFPTRTTAAPPLTSSGDPQAGEESQVPPEEGGQTASAAVWLQGAQQAAIWRCRELATSRLKNAAAKHHVTLPASVDRVDDATWAKLGNPSPHQLVVGGASALRVLLESHGWGTTEADRACAEVEAYAATTLRRADPFGDDR